MKISRLCLATVATLMMASCTNDDLYKYNAQRFEQLQKEQFAEYFTKKFGEIPANQTWDFAGRPLTRIAADMTRATRAGGNITCTPDEGYEFLNEEGYYDVPASLQTTMNKIEENVDNSQMGNTYAMLTPENSFTIIPVRQGYSTSAYEVHMVVGTGDDATDYLLWKKGEMMQTRKAGSTEKWKNVQNIEKSYTYGNNDVRSKALTFKNIPSDQPIYFYVYRPTLGIYPSSLDGYMKDFSSAVTLPQQLLDAGKQVKLIGAEIMLNASDYDYEDVMFLIVGDPKLPEDITPNEPMSFEQTISKRYMIEDLGETDDTDYNDIVVDVTSTRTIQYDYNPTTGEITNQTYGEWGEQTATIRHLGGTLPFNLTIGNTELGWMKGQMNVDPNTVHDITGWNPDANNISISVRQTGSGDGVNSLTFPAAGNVPLIIATSTKQPWMQERVSIIPYLKDIIKQQNME